MLEDYLKRLESLMTPRCFSMTNLHSKKPNPDVEKSNKKLETIEETNEKTKEKESNKEIGKKFSTLKLTVSERLLTSEGEIIPENYREIVHQLQVKNMNYRHELSLLKAKIEKYEKEIDQKNGLITRLQKQKDDDNKYILRLEGVSSKFGTSIESPKPQAVEKKTIISFVERKNEKEAKMNQSKSTNNVLLAPSVNQSGFVFNESNLNLSGISDVIYPKGLNLNDKKSVKEFALKILSENKKLKAFQTKIFEVSKTYDTLNESLSSGLKEIKKYFESVAELNNIEGSSLSKASIEFDKVLSSLKKLIKVKQELFNFLIENKSLETKLYADELTKFKEALELNKKDRLRDLKIISDLEKTNEHNLERLKKFENGEREREERKPLKIADIEYKLSPAKDSMKNFVKKFCETFDLSDKRNRNFIERINDTLK